MSTFDGFVKEFPSIRIDYFRHQPDRPPPAACFLTHVHSDHLQGLETLKMPFVYCSATTRRLLLRMEKYPCRLNFANGILESRKQTYKHLRLVLRALPLHTCTEIELNPLQKIQVVMFDANHCPGAVSFLIQDQASAIFYTGDIRAEPWWVNSLVQNPYILPYTCGIKTLDCIYLDTTFASHNRVYRSFPSKADGLKELLRKLTLYPPATVFYFRAWTLGYEQVWMAMSSLLSSQVHVEDYQLRLFHAITEHSRDGYAMFEAPPLVGFTLGNQHHPGCLTLSSDTRIHSCEPGMECHSHLNQADTVWVSPIVSRLEDGTELPEVGAGGGLGDLHPTAELEVDDLALVQQLSSLCAELRISGALLEQLQEAIATAQASARARLPLDGLGLDGEAISVHDFIDRLSKKQGQGLPVAAAPAPRKDLQSSGNVLHFPYSRHSSYEELRHFVSVFRPRDLCPCTVHVESWSEDISMQSLFGDLCSSTLFFHDRQTRAQVQAWEMRPGAHQRRPRGEDDPGEEKASQSQSQAESASTRLSLSSESEIIDTAAPNGQVNTNGSDVSVHKYERSSSVPSTAFEALDAEEHPAPDSLNGKSSGARRSAYNAALRCLLDSDASDWQDLVLRSVGRHGHTVPEPEL